jgi:hypothetical protein
MIHIIGGGLQGCFFAIALMEQSRIPRDRIRLYDPADNLLDRWLKQSAACGMTHLRSNSSHSIHYDFNHLRCYARDRGVDLWDSPEFALPYHRPSIGLFNDHAAMCIERYGLEELHVRTSVDAMKGSGAISVGGEELEGIALYAGGFQHGGPNFPGWARDLAISGVPIRHVFGSALPGSAPRPPSTGKTRRRREIIVGGGISALQYAIKSAGENRRPLMVTRRELEIYRFDFDPCFIGPKCRPRLEQQERQRGPQGRMDLVLSGRLSGTVPGEIHDQFMDLVKSRRAELIVAGEDLAGEVTRRAGETGAEVILCTGFRRPTATDWGIAGLDGEGMISGYPRIGSELKIGRRMFLTGASAMYRLGPAAPNLIGAHLAWRVINAEIAAEYSLMTA